VLEAAKRGRMDDPVPVALEGATRGRSFLRHETTPAPPWIGGINRPTLVRTAHL
jgi:hypothetical protein